MIQKLKAALDADDRAVSPVIGVILMVAITVILAAVIASLTLGLGDSAQTAPTAKFDFDQSTVNYDDGTTDSDLKTVKASFLSGQNLEEGQITVLVDGNAALSIDESTPSSHAGVAPYNGFDTIGAGSSVSIAAANESSSAAATITYDAAPGNDITTTDVSALSAGDKIEIVWTSEDGSTSSTLASYTVQ